MLAQISDSDDIIQNLPVWIVWPQIYGRTEKNTMIPILIFRGLVSEIGFKRTAVEYVHEKAQTWQVKE